MLKILLAPVRYLFPPFLFGFCSVQHGRNPQLLIAVATWGVKWRRAAGRVLHAAEGA
jgi:hypothetical protein